MSDEMAVGDNASSEEPKVGADEVAVDAPVAEQTSKESAKSPTAESGDAEKTNIGTEESAKIKNDDEKDLPDNDEKGVEEDKRGVKRRASAAFSDDGDFRGFEQTDQNDLTEFNKIVEEEWKFLRRYSTDEDFKGFDRVEMNNLTAYSNILERLEAEVTEAVKSFTPLRNISTTLPPSKASKRPRQDTDSSRPSSALSSRSDGDGAVSTDHQRINGSKEEVKHFRIDIIKEEVKASSSPLGRGRRPTTEMSSPLLRVPLERGWKRELVFRAALDAHSRRNADIYYYTPQGKKLRSTREVSEHLSGTGLTLENFSFFKEPLGIDDPEKEIIRDAKLMRRVESPVAAPTPVEGKRTPKPKPPKGASPEHNTPKSPPSKIKVKSMGSRLNNNSAPVTPQPVAQKAPRRQSAQAQPAPPAQPPQPQPQPAPAADNNNTAPWKKPRTAPPPLLARPPAAPAPAQVGRGLQQPCSMACGRAVPSLACAACLCLYHPACLGFVHPPPHPFYCKNCETSPPRDPPPLVHKSGVTTNTGLQTPTPITPVSSNHSANKSANMSANVSANTVPVPRRVLVPSKQRSDKRVLLRMKMSGGADGQKVWAVSPSATGAAQPHGPNTPAAPAAMAPIAPTASPVTPLATHRQTLPQSLAVINGRRFIVVARGQQN